MLFSISKKCQICIFIFLSQTVSMIIKLFKYISVHISRFYLNSSPEEIIIYKVFFGILKTDYSGFVWVHSQNTRKKMQYTIDEILDIPF